VAILRSYYRKLRFLTDKFRNFDNIMVHAAACVINPRNDPYSFLHPVLRLVKAYYDHQLPVRSPVAWNADGRITSFAYVYDPEEPEVTQEELQSRCLLYEALGYAGTDPRRPAARGRSAR
jgi:hypothetical protein